MDSSRQALLGIGKCVQLLLTDMGPGFLFRFEVIYTFREKMVLAGSLNVLFMRLVGLILGDIMVTALALGAATEEALMGISVPVIDIGNL